MEVERSVSPLMLYPWGNSPQHPLDMKVDGPRVSLDEVEKGKISGPSEIKSRFFGHPVYSPSLYQISYNLFPLDKHYLILNIILFLNIILSSNPKDNTEIT
jgi:hypothetical protein